MAVESEEEDVVIRMINSASALRSETLDLGAKSIYKIPNEILNLKQLEVGLSHRICSRQFLTSYANAYLLSI